LLPDEPSDFGRMARSAGVLTAGRQVGALVLTAGVLLLPRYVAAAVLDAFLWVYFAQLLVSSLLNLGLERFTARELAGGDAARRSAVAAAGLRGRLWSAPLTPLVLWVVLTFVHVHLPVQGWLAATTWTLAVQVQGVAFAALRAADRAQTEAGVAFSGRVLQTVVLLGFAMSGAGLSALLWSVAAIDVGVAVVGGLFVVRLIGSGPAAALPFRKLGVYTVLEISVFAYVRADLVIVGRLLGSRDGATYGLGYRVLDALVGLAGPAILVLFAYASGHAARGRDMASTRRRAEALLPHLGAALAALAIVMVAPLVALLPRLDAVAPALRILLATLPMTYLIGVEAHLLSAEDRNRVVVIVAGVTLALNVGLNLVLVPRFGMLGAAAALLTTEAVQLAALVGGADAPGARRAALDVAPTVGLLLLGGLALNRAAPAVGVVLLAVAVAVAARHFRSGLEAEVAVA
jgi:O-antigen/teichoic acid export membrane protein